MLRSGPGPNDDPARNTTGTAGSDARSRFGRYCSTSGLKGDCATELTWGLALSHSMVRQIAVKTSRGKSPDSNYLCFLIATEVPVIRRFNNAVSWEFLEYAFDPAWSALRTPRFEPQSLLSPAILKMTAFRFAAGRTEHN